MSCTQHHGHLFVWNFRTCHGLSATCTSAEIFSRKSKNVPIRFSPHHCTMFLLLCNRISFSIFWSSLLLFKKQASKCELGLLWVFALKNIELEKYTKGEDCFCLIYSTANSLNIVVARNPKGNKFSVKQKNYCWAYLISLSTVSMKIKLT